MAINITLNALGSQGLDTRLMFPGSLPAFVYAIDKFERSIEYKLVVNGVVSETNHRIDFEGENFEYLPSPGYGMYGNITSAALSRDGSLIAQLLIEDTNGDFDFLGGVPVSSLATMTMNSLATVAYRYGVNFTLNGNAGADRLSGSDYIDTLNGSLGADFMQGFGGNDTYFVDNAGDQIFELAGEGTDSLFASASYVLAAGQSIETLQTTNAAGTTAISLTGNEFAQTLVGNAGANILNGGGGNDTIRAGSGNDDLQGGLGGDMLQGGFGADRHVGGDDAGIDYARYDDANYGALTIRLLNPQFNTGAAAGDTYIGIEGLIGGAGNDTVIGNAARNYLWGGGGNDLIDGAGGSDFLNGGLGADDFRFTTALGAGNVDTIDGFQHGTDDILLLRSVFTGIGTSLDAAEFGADANNFIIYDQATGRLSFDANGTAGGAAPVHFASVTAGTVLDINDFVMV